jgi:hypothetical protein
MDHEDAFGQAVALQADRAAGPGEFRCPIQVQPDGLTGIIPAGAVRRQGCFTNAEQAFQKFHAASLFCPFILSILWEAPVNMNLPRRARRKIDREEMYIFVTFVVIVFAQIPSTRQGT